MTMLKQSIALAITPPDRPAAVLIVQRPADDEDLPAVWGLPAASLLAGESVEHAVQRIGRDKLGVELGIGAVLEHGATHRSAYLLDMRVIAAVITGGEPHAPQPVSGVTQYQAWRWGTATDLEPAAAAGSLCSQLYLRRSELR
jgi:ADP-ribose pyrophosphatase YjhB (NUDIX family)